MYVKKFEKEELLSVYQTYGPLYFPKDELKPVETIDRLFDRERYRGFGLFRKDDDMLLGFALFVQVPGQACALLDYYAMRSEFRCGGLGGIFLHLLQANLAGCSGFYIETENPDFAPTDAERELQTRRIGFYQRNGATQAGLYSRLFGVPYRVLYLTCQPDAPAVASQAHYQNLDAIYRAMFSEAHYKTEVELRQQ